MPSGFDRIGRRALMVCAYAAVLVVALGAAYRHVAAPLDLRLLDAQQRFVRAHYPRPARPAPPPPAAPLRPRPPPPPGARRRRGGRPRRGFHHPGPGADRAPAS